ncbi:MAG TPA: efflux RND transporter periplasmic adaptor subunit [Ensifer sp.]|jgi:putative peptide zinc metalloprotease protein|uniref:efflux RND transporter periplasmic adaptor subunit n=1 Tax=Ensifer sp. TaxID=1872086 RepID=UPI002E1368DA|nr:efflux RND transporter periplasmic adaptor subunit [Ensifer sp.]
MAGIAITPPMPGGRAATLPPLRMELVLQQGPTLRDGSPSWTLHDPPANRYYRLGWLEFEILYRWHLRDPDLIARRIHAETTLTPSRADVERVADFVTASELNVDLSLRGTASRVERAGSRRESWARTLLHHYLFIRIPLVRPDPLLTRLLPLSDIIYTRTFLLLTVLAGLLGLHLALRQWDAFASALPWFFSLEGVAVAALAVVASKILHEVAHGLTAKRFGCRVPTMGVALLVMAPVLYTDTSAAWQLRDRRQRLAIGAAGMIAECGLAAYALLAWSFLPDGLLRSVVLVWATTTWLLTLLINLSPFMRFDGYYLLSDLLDVPNLQERAFSLTRYEMRRLLFGVDDPPPEHWPPDLRRILVAYALSTWAYRAVIFFGIALLVYHMFFKALGLFLFAVEIWWFLLRPIVREMAWWVRRARGHALNRRTLMTCLIAVFLLALLCVPWRTSIHAPALLGAQTRVRVFTQMAGEVEAVAIRTGAFVAAGDPLLVQRLPEVAYKLQQAQQQVASLIAQWQAAAQDGALQPRAQLLAGDIVSARAALAAAQADSAHLTVHSPISGTIVERAEPLKPGEWIKSRELIGVIADLSTTRITAYVEEAELGRIAIGVDATFVPADVAQPRVTARVQAIDTTATRLLTDAELASVNGGPIPSRMGTDESPVPDLPMYRITLIPDQMAPIAQTRMGTIIISGQPAAPLQQFWRRAVSILIRESGF